MTGRGSYCGLMRLPVYAIYRDERVVATVRAHGPEEARRIFEHHNLPRPGDKLRKL